MSDEFDLRELARDTYRENLHLDSYKLWTEVVAAIPDDELRDVMLGSPLSGAGIKYVRTEAVSFVKRENDPNPRTPAEFAPPRTGLSDSSRRVSRNKIAADTLNRRLCEVVVVADGVEKEFGDCYQDDLIAAAIMREDQAAANNRQAAKYRQTAKVMTSGQTVRDLPSVMLSQIWD